jgi:hypothetical protein
MSSAPTDLIEEFYGAFAECAGERMAACYAPDASFSDPVFGALDAREAGGMWRMLTGQAKDLRIDFGSPRTALVCTQMGISGLRELDIGLVVRGFGVGKDQTYNALATCA